MPTEPNPQLYLLAQCRQLRLQVQLLRVRRPHRPADPRPQQEEGAYYGTRVLIQWVTDPAQWHPHT